MAKKSIKMPINKATGLFLLIGVVAIAGLQLGIARPAKQLKEDTKKELVILNQEVALLQARTTLLSSGREDPLLAIQQRAQTLSEYLPNEVDITLFATVLPQLAQNRNVIITFNVNETTEISKAPGANFIPISIIATGAFDALAGLIDDIAQLDKLATLFNPKIEKSKATIAAPTEVQFILTAELRAWYSTTSILPEAPSVQPKKESTPTEEATEPSQPVSEADINEAYAIIEKATNTALLDTGRTLLKDSDFADIDMDSKTPGFQPVIGEGPWRFISKNGIVFLIDPDKGRLSQA
jgi:Tfp pilus assembly protein PilO